MNRITLRAGDITTVRCDAIVNAANKRLLGGGGVDGAIHKAAGPGLLEECRELGGCETGEARVTKGYNLPAEYVIHAVGPVWKSGLYNEMEELASCYRSIMKIASELKLKSVAIPGISTGVYRFPKGVAAEIAVKEVTRFLDRNPYPETVIFVIMDEELYGHYKKLVVI